YRAVTTERSLKKVPLFIGVIDTSHRAATAIIERSSTAIFLCFPSKNKFIQAFRREVGTKGVKVIGFGVKLLQQKQTAEFMVCKAPRIFKRQVQRGCIVLVQALIKRCFPIPAAIGINLQRIPFFVLAVHQNGYVVI